MFTTSDRRVLMKLWSYDCAVPVVYENGHSDFLRLKFIPGFKRSPRTRSPRLETVVENIIVLCRSFHQYLQHVVLVYCYEDIESSRYQTEQPSSNVHIRHGDASFGTTINPCKRSTLPSQIQEKSPSVAESRNDEVEYNERRLRTNDLPMDRWQLEATERRQNVIGQELASDLDQHWSGSSVGNRPLDFSKAL